MAKLIVFEGIDGTGKSIQSQHGSMDSQACGLICRLDYLREVDRFLAGMLSKRGWNRFFDLTSLIDVANSCG